MTKLKFCIRQSLGKEKMFPSIPISPVIPLVDENNIFLSLAPFSFIFYIGR